MWTNENRSLYDRRTLRYPSDLTYEEWALIEPPPRKPPSDPLAKSWDIAYRIFCEGNYRQTETLDKDDQRSVRLPRRELGRLFSLLRGGSKNAISRKETAR